MAGPVTLLADLARAKAAFQQRTILAILETDMHPFDHNSRLLDEHHDQPDPIGQEEGETCGRYPEPDEDAPRGYKPKPCKGVMLNEIEWEPSMCQVCGAVGD